MTLVVTGCAYDGITTVSLPFREGTGDDSWQLTVEMAQVSGLTENSEVKVDDVTVGTIDHIEVDGWNAVLEVGLNDDVTLPADATARVGQKSMLGAKYLELAAPPGGGSSEQLGDGDTIVLGGPANYPETEQVLASLAVVLNGSGLQQVRTITEELNGVLGDRAPDVRKLVTNFREFLTVLDGQRDDIVTLIDRLDATTATLRRDRVLDTALETLPGMLTTLDEDRADLTRTLSAVGRLGEVSNQVISESGANLTANLRQLRPALQALADSGSDLTESLSLLVSFPFPSNSAFPAMFRGDYGNLFLTLDVSPDLLAKNLLDGFGSLLPDDDSSLLNAPPLGGGDEVNSPLQPFLDDLTGALPQLPGLGGLGQLTDNLLGQLVSPRTPKGR